MVLNKKADEMKKRHHIIWIIFSILFLTACSHSSSDDQTSSSSAIDEKANNNAVMNGLMEIQQQPYTLEIKPAIVQVKNGPHLPLSNESLSTILTHEITVTLNQTHRFDILSKIHEYSLDSTDNNQPIQQDKDVTQRQQILLTTDYYLVTTLAQLDTQQESYVLKATGQKIYQKVVSATVLYQLIDTKNQKIALSNTINYQLKNTANTETASSVITLALSNIANLIEKQITDAIYPVRVLSVDDKRVILDQPLPIGTKCAITKLGQQIHDSYSKSLLGNEQTIVGQLIVTEQTNVIAYGNLLSGLAEEGNICRILADDPIQRAPELIKRTEQGGVILPFDQSQ